MKIIPGKIYKHQFSSLLILATDNQYKPNKGREKDTRFKGVVISENENLKKGHYSKLWAKNKFKETKKRIKQI